MAVRPVVTTASGTLTALAAGASSGTIYTVPASTETRIVHIAIDGLGGGDVIFLRSNTYRAVRILESDLVDGAIDLGSKFYYFEAGDVLTIQNGSAGAITITYYISIIEQADTVDVEARGITGTTALLAKGDNSAVLYTVPVDTEARIMVVAVNPSTGTSASTTALLINDHWMEWFGLVEEEAGIGYEDLLVYMEAGDELKLHFVDPPGPEVLPDETFHFYFSILEHSL